MEVVFEELDYQKTSLGEISLRRRSEPRLDNIIIYEVKLGEEFLMSSLFTEAEIQLAKLGLEALRKNCSHSNEFEIVVGGLGLGYTAAAVLENPTVKSLLVIDVMEPVINWHQSELVPLGKTLTSDTRCKLLHADFYQLAASANSSFTENKPNQHAHAVLLDIDHSPSHLLNPGNRSFYTETGLQQLATKLYPGGIFGLWSNEPPDGEFSRLLESAFYSVETHIVTFPNPYTQSKSSNTVYIAYKKR